MGLGKKAKREAKAVKGKTKKEHYSKFHVIEKKKSPLAASNASG